MELIEKALLMSVVAHKDQVRKDNGTPYVVHPIMVSRIIERYGFPEEVIAAALVHDVLEDSAVTEAELKEELNDAVVQIVAAVSEDKSLVWEERKKAYIEAVVASSEDVKAVSVADKIHNAQCLLRAYQKEGASVWTKFNRGRTEKIWFERTLCDRLKEVWNHSMLEEYERLVEELEATVA